MKTIVLLKFFITQATASRVRGGKWIFNRGRTYGEPAYYCSECSEGSSEYGYDKFCPNCGAKMKGGAE